MPCLKGIGFADNTLQNSIARQQAIPPLLRRMLVRPSQQCIVIDAFMHRTPARACVGLAFEGRVTGAHDCLSDVIEAVRRMVRDFLGEVCAAVALLEVFDQVRLFKVRMLLYAQGESETGMVWLTRQ